MRNSRARNQPVRRKRLSIWSALLAVLALGAASQASAEYCTSGRTVAFAGVNWESGEFLTALTRELLERGFGCKTVAVPGNSVTLEQAVANDDVQIFAEEWVSRSDVWKKAVDAGQALGVGHPFVGAEEGWFVPEYMVKGDPTRHIRAAAPDLRRVAQLSDPFYVALFRDPEQPDKGRFLNCPSGWSCEALNTAKLQGYHLDAAYVDFRPGTGPAMDAAITSAYLQGQPLLFYYWSPSAIAGKLKLFRLGEPPYSPGCQKNVGGPCASPPAEIAYGVSRKFYTAAPEIIAVLQKATLPLPELNANLASQAAKQIDAKAQAIAFLKEKPEIWRAWVPPEVALRIEASLQDGGAAPAAAPTAGLPAKWVISIRKPVNAAVAGLVSQHSGGFRAVSHVMLSVVVVIDQILAFLPWWLVIAIFAGLAWAGTRRVVLTVVVAGLMATVGLLGLWDMMLQTLTLMLVSSLIALVVGLPVGVWAAKSRKVKAMVMPSLDIMQTMPSFVYLIPALMLFGLGKAPAILATIIYALPPMIRLTALGLEQVDPELKEAVTAFGVTPWRMLWSVELPLARPSLMAGVNQTIMLALSMVVVASMIGARGLGEQVLNGIQTLDVGQGLEAGIGIVILAVVLDRITQGFGAVGPGPGARSKHG